MRRPKSHAPNLRLLLCLLALLLPGVPAAAQEESGRLPAPETAAPEIAGSGTPPETTVPEAAAPEVSPSPPPSPPAPDAVGPIPPVSSEHAFAVDGGELRYRAVAGTLPVQGPDGRPEAHVFTVSYLLAKADPSTRPVTFVFNGGPGAASAYLHLGALGPQVLATAPDGTLPPPPPRLADNPDTWLAFTDLVFIDPVGTGLSRPAASGPDAYKPFFSVSGDVASLGEVVRLWLTRNDRWLSPKFLAGESYGGLRAALMARDLLRGHGIAMNGLVMISPALDFSTIDSGGTSLLPWAFRLPSMALSARAHGKAPADLDVAGLERWSLGDYVAGMAAIDPPGPGPAAEIIDELVRLTGLERELVERHHGRIPISVFAEHLLADRGQVLSLYDGALAGTDSDPAGDSAPDPLLDASVAPLSSAFNAYLGGVLGLKAEQPFRLLARRPSREWDWQGVRDGTNDGAMGDLAETLALTPGLGILAVHGRTDLVTPYLATKWLFDRLPLPEHARERVEVAVLEGGHMMYFSPAQRAELTSLARDFYEKRLPRN